MNYYKFYSDLKGKLIGKGSLHDKGQSSGQKKGKEKGQFDMTIFYSKNPNMFM